MPRGESPAGEATRSPDCDWQVTERNTNPQFAGETATAIPAENVLGRGDENIGDEVLRLKMFLDIDGSNMSHLHTCTSIHICK